MVELHIRYKEGIRMNRKTVSGIMVTLLLVGTLLLVFNIQPVRAIGTIYIRPDGSIDPSLAPIHRDGDLYTLTSNITCDADGIVIERNNMTLDGAGYTVQGIGAYPSKGIFLSGRSNVTIKNMKSKDFWFGVFLKLSSNNTISGNNITTNNLVAVWLQESSSNNDVSDNTLANNIHGIVLSGVHNNSVYRNNITTNHQVGIWVIGSNNNVYENCITNNNHRGINVVDASNGNIVENTIAKNGYAITLYNSLNNLIYHNDFIGNTRQVYNYNSTNAWDDGYPSGGNYWSNYIIRYPDAQELDDSGIWNTPYYIDGSNQDNYPLMEPWTPIPPVEDTEAYIEYVNETIHDLPDGIFSRPEEDVPDVKNDFSDLFDDALENIDEGNYEGAIEKLNTIKTRMYEEIVESEERQEVISMIDDLIAYLETLL